MTSKRTLPSALFIVLLLLRLAVPLLAGEPYLAPGHPDGIALLAPPPLPGTPEGIADLNSARAVFKARTPAEEARAKKDGTLTFDLFASAIGPAFQLDKLPKTEALLKEVKSEIRTVINTPKKHWKRLRPYQVDPQLTFGEPENSYSYPSGHSSSGMVYALVLAKVCPEKEAAIIEIGRNIGWDRVLIGKHFPTDVQAGRVLAQAIVREMMLNPAFQQDLAAAKAELLAAQAAAPAPATKP